MCKKKDEKIDTKKRNSIKIAHQKIPPSSKNNNITVSTKKIQPTQQ